jgi:hypothetical protein
VSKPVVGSSRSRTAGWFATALASCAGLRYMAEPEFAYE